MEHEWEPRALCRAGVRCAKCFQIAWEPNQNEPCEGVSKDAKLIEEMSDEDDENTCK